MGAVDLSKIDDADDVGMAELRSEPRLSVELSNEILVLAERGKHSLEAHPLRKTTGAYTCSLKCLCHAADTQPALEIVATEVARSLAHPHNSVAPPLRCGRGLIPPFQKALAPLSTARHLARHR